jgi:hypothetical protein
MCFLCGTDSTISALPLLASKIEGASVLEADITNCGHFKSLSVSNLFALVLTYLRFLL